MRYYCSFSCAYCVWSYSSAELVYVWTHIRCAWLVPPALVISIVGLARGHEARWLKFLPACIFGIATLTLNMHFHGAGLMSFAPPEIVVAGIVACVGALLFSGKRGMMIGGSALCCVVAATLL